MLANLSTGQYSQIGWYYDNGSGTRVFTQVNNQPGVETKFGTAYSSYGSFPYFTALYNNPSGKFSFQVGGTNWVADLSGDSTPYQPTASWTPHDVEVFAERHNNADQVPGGTSAWAGRYDAHIYSGGAWNDGWLTTNNNGISFQGIDPSSGNGGYYHGKQWYTWDTACST